MRKHVQLAVLTLALCFVSMVSWSQVATPAIHELQAGAGAPTMTVTLNSANIYPSGTGGASTTTVTVTVRIGNNPLQNRTVSLRASSTGGGHSHTAGRPVGSFTAATGRTNANGVYSTTYTAPACGGTGTITATCGGSTGSANITIRVPDLVTIGAGTGYTLVGANAAHPDNHYVTANSRTHLRNIGSDWDALAGVQPALRYNDCSLVQGGLFDLGPTVRRTYQYWHSPHDEHRVGRNCDLSLSNLTDAQEDDLSPIIGNRGGTIHDEGDH